MESKTSRAFVATMALEKMSDERKRLLAEGFVEVCHGIFVKTTTYETHEIIEVATN